MTTTERPLTPRERWEADRASVAWQEWHDQRMADLASTFEKRGDSLLHFVEDRSLPDDPPGTRRYRVVDPGKAGGGFPLGPLNGGAIVGVVALVAAWL